MTIADLKISIDVISLADKELPYCELKFRMFYPVQAAGFNRPESSCNFVLALCTRVETFDPLLYCILNPLMKTGLKVQTIDVVKGPPVATVKILRIS